MRYRVDNFRVIIRGVFFHRILFLVRCRVYLLCHIWRGNAHPKVQGGFALDLDVRSDETCALQIVPRIWPLDNEGRRVTDRFVGDPDPGRWWEICFAEQEGAC